MRTENYTNGYYSFGSAMPGRNFTSNAYMYGFNGKEKDDEVKGSGASYDYGFRIYDPRAGRFLSVDPISGNFPYYSPYHFAGNTPIQALDLDGLEILNYKTPYRLTYEGTQLKMKYSWSDGSEESRGMVQTGAAISQGLAGINGGESAPLDIPVYPTAVNQYVYEIAEGNMAAYNLMVEPVDVTDDENEGQGMAAKKKKGETYVRTNKVQNIQNRGAATADAIEGGSKFFFGMSPLAKGLEAKMDINTMVQAYGAASRFVEKSYNWQEFAKVNSNWTPEDVNNFKADIANFVVDMKLPNGKSDDYNKMVEGAGLDVIANFKSEGADAQKKLRSSDE